MEMAMCKCMKESEVDRFFFLPDDILEDILKRIPDVFLSYKVRYVCTRWLDIITNSILLDHAFFIIQNPQTRLKARLVDIWEERQGPQLTEQDIALPGLGGSIRSWCNEFLLFSCDFSNPSLLVLNLNTKEISLLPEDITSCGFHYASRCGIALSFDGYEGVYKVVHLFMGPPVECEILVLRSGMVCPVSSKWKKIQVPPYMMNKGTHIWGEAVSVQGRYLHWRIKDSNDLVSVDAVIEEVCQMTLPGSGKRGRFVHSIFEMDGFLAFFDGVTSWNKAEIWVLKDFHTVEWEKFQSITIDNSYFQRYPRKIKRYIFHAMISKRYIILESKFEHGMYSYDLKCGVMKKLDIDVCAFDKRRVVHTWAPPCPIRKPKTI